MATSRVAAPGGVDIVIRRLDFPFTSEIPRYWMDGDPYSTHFMNALSLLFPAGESVFMESVRHYRDRVRDSALMASVRAFLGQEGYHRREHDAFNGLLRSHGIDVDDIYARIDEGLGEAQRRMSPRQRLAFTCALEHFTAIMADHFMKTPELTEAIDERVRMLWIWHAIEETEHKAVAYDVYQHIGGTYRMRVIMMMIITVTFLCNVNRILLRLMREDGQLWNVRSWLRGINRFWGPRGHFVRIIPAYLDYYRRNFHPWQHDNSALLARAKARLEREAPDAAETAAVPKMAPAAA